MAEDKTTLDSLGERVADYLRQSDLPAPIKQYLGIKGFQGSVLGKFLGGDPQAEAMNVYRGEDFDPSATLKAALGVVGAPAVGPAEAGGAVLGAGLLRLGKGAPKGGGEYPGIFKRPDLLAAEAEALVAPEHPALKALFGVTRADLADIGQQGRRAGTILQPAYGGSDIANPGSSYVGYGVMTPGNEQRLIDALGEATTKAPRLVQGMDAWYVMDPAYQRLVQLAGPQQAGREYTRLNTLTSMASPGSDVLTEIRRGTAANMMAQRGEFPVFQQYGGLKLAKRGADFPPELVDMMGHPFHPTSHARPMEQYLERGAVEMTSPKVPLYIQASGVPELGFQTVLPVPDAHFTRAIGAADVRAAHGVKNPGVSMKTPEYRDVGPWFRTNIAQPLGIEAVPAQGRLWGLMSPQTGVDTAIGAPKLELLAQRIWDRALAKGIDPRVLRDAVLRGTAHAGVAAGVLGPGLNALSDEE